MFIHSILKSENIFYEKKHDKIIFVVARQQTKTHELILKKHQKKC